MKNFLHSHPNIVIGTLAGALVLVLVGFYSWAIDDVFDQMGRALASPSARSVVGFDLLGASKLDLRGLMDDGANPAPIPTPVSVTAPTPTVATTTATAKSTSVASSSMPTP
jgi:hypothetical protein